MRAYYVNYRSWQCGEVKGVMAMASNAGDAYMLAVYEEIPKIEGRIPYSAWVVSVTYNNGRCHYFNTCEGLPY